MRYGEWKYDVMRMPVASMDRIFAHAPEDRDDWRVWLREIAWVGWRHRQAGGAVPVYEQWVPREVGIEWHWPLYSEIAALAHYGGEDIRDELARTLWSGFVVSELRKRRSQPGQRQYWLDYVSVLEPS